MNCKLVKNLIPEFVEGELTDEQSGAVRKHIDKCTSCGRELRTYQQFYEKLAVDFSEEISPFFWTKFDRELNERLAGPPERVLPSRRFVVARAFAVAAAVMVFFMIGLMTQQGGRITIFGESDLETVAERTTPTHSTNAIASRNDTSSSHPLISDEVREVAQTRLAEMEGRADSVIVPMVSANASDMRVVTERTDLGMTPAQRGLDRRAQRK